MAGGSRMRVWGFMCPPQRGGSCGHPLPGLYKLVFGINVENIRHHRITPGSVPVAPLHEPPPLPRARENQNFPLQPGETPPVPALAAHSGSSSARPLPLGQEPSPEGGVGVSPLGGGQPSPSALGAAPATGFWGKANRRLIRGVFPGVPRPPGRAGGLQGGTGKIPGPRAPGTGVGRRWVSPEPQPTATTRSHGQSPAVAALDTPTR